MHFTYTYVEKSRPDDLKEVSHMLSNQATLLSTRLSTRTMSRRWRKHLAWTDQGQFIQFFDEKMSIQVKERASASGAVKVTAKKHRWYLGGFASAMAACCTHPLDLLKVRPQLRQLQGVEISFAFAFGSFSDALNLL